MTVEFNNPKFIKTLFTQEELENRIFELSQWVNEEYKDSKQLVLIGMLKGCMPFMAQLIKGITVDNNIDFMIVSSYEGATESSGNLKVIADSSADLFDKDVLIVEDIVDTGLTLSKVKKMILDRNPKSLKLITLLDKPEGRKVEVHIDKVGFKIPNEFIVGYGLDFEEKYRNLPFITTFDPEA